MSSSLTSVCPFRFEQSLLAVAEMTDTHIMHTVFAAV